MVATIAVHETRVAHARDHRLDVPIVGDPAAEDVAVKPKRLFDVVDHQCEVAGAKRARDELARHRTGGVERYRVDLGPAEDLTDEVVGIGDLDEIEHAAL